MSGFGSDILVNAKLAYCNEIDTLDRIAYHRWVQHNVDLLEAIRLWAYFDGMGDATKEAALTVVLPELTQLSERLRRIGPLGYFKMGFGDWNDFLLWARENPEPVET